MPIDTTAPFLDVTVADIPVGFRPDPAIYSRQPRWDEELREWLIVLIDFEAKYAKLICQLRQIELDELLDERVQASIGDSGSVGIAPMMAMSALSRVEEISTNPDKAALIEQIRETRRRIEASKQ